MTEYKNVLVFGEMDGENLSSVTAQVMRIGKILSGDIVVDMKYRISVDCGLSFEEMIKKSNCSWVADEIKKPPLPIKGKGKQDLFVKLFHFHQEMTVDGVIAEMKKQGCRPAKIEELLAFSGSYVPLGSPDVIALGSIRDKSVPCVGYLGSLLSLRLYQLKIIPGDEHIACYFLAVCLK